jgi:prepilin-type N-terminal cleavage/methylation domain-containing protein
MRILKTLKSKSGVTLMELIVGVVIFAIITTAVSAVLAPMLRAYSHANELAELNALLDTIANPIKNDMSDATDPLEKLGIDNEILIPINTNTIKYTIGGDGVLLCSVNDSPPMPVLPKTFYNNKSVDFRVIRIDPPEAAYTLTIIIRSDRDDGREMARRDYAVRPLVLNQYNNYQHSNP